MTRVLLSLPCLLLFGIAFVTPDDALPVHGDVDVYHRVSLAVMQGQLPYRDIALEYPPAAVLPMLVPRILVPGAALDVVTYRLLLAAWNALLASVIAGLVLPLVRRSRPAADARWHLVAYAGLLGLGTSILPWRFDLFPIALGAGGITLVLMRRPAWAGVALGVAVSAKLYPIVLLAVGALWLLAGDDRRGATRLLGAAIATVALVVTPFVIADLGGALGPLVYQGGRGLEIESVGAGIISTIAQFRLTTVEWVNEFGAIHLDSPLTPVLLRGSLLLAVTLFPLFLVTAWERFRHVTRPADHPGVDRHEAAASLVTACMVGMALLLLTSKVFSAQFVWWLLPFGALLRGARLALLALVMGLTVAVYPSTFLDLVDQVPWAIALLDLRNALLVVLTVLLWRDLRPRGVTASRPVRLGIAVNATALIVVAALVLRSVAPVPVVALPGCRPTAAQLGLSRSAAVASAGPSEPGDCRSP